MHVSHLIVNQAGDIIGGNTTVPTGLDVRLLAMLASALVPLAVNFLTKLSASDGLRAVVNIVATAVVTVLALWINPTDQNINGWVAANTFLYSLVTSFAAYKAVWKPTGVSGKIAVRTANIGLNSPPTLETAEKGAEDRGQVDNDPKL